MRFIKDCGIEVVRRSDIESLRRFFEEESVLYFSARYDFNSYLLQLIDEPSKIMVVAKVSNSSYCLGSIVGFASLDIIRRPRGGSLAYLGEVLVSRRFRKIGLGSSLVEHLVHLASESKVHRIVLHAHERHANFYLRQGFVLWEGGLKLDFTL